MQCAREEGRWMQSWCAAAAFALPLALYLWTLAPSLTYEDSGEFLAGATVLGVVHPPGYPLWCLLAHAFTWIPLGTVAQRINSCSAVFAAGTIWLAYLCGARLCGRRVPALMAALALGASRLLWSQAVVAEVYSLNAFLTALAVYLVLRWRDDRRPRWLLALALVLGLGLANHPLIGLLAPALGIWALAIDWRCALAPRTLGLGALLLVAGLSVYAYIPLRARAHPPIDWGHATTLAKTLRHALRQDFKEGDEKVRTQGSGADVLAHGARALSATGTAFTWPLAGLALIGALGLARRRRAFLLFSLAAVALNALVLNALLRARADPTWYFVHRVYYIPAHILVALWLAEGLAMAARGCARWRPAGSRLALGAGAALVLAAALLNAPHASRRGDQRARDFALDLLDSLPPGSLVYSFQDQVVFGLAYLKWVEGRRPDVRLVHPAFGGADQAARTWVLDEPLTPWSRARAMEPRLAHAETVPCGLAYVVVSPADARANPHAFVPLRHTPRWPGPPSPGFDPFDALVRSHYARYAAYLGAALWRAGREEEAQRTFARAEALDPDDAYAHFVLGTTYRELGIRPERARAAFRRALECFERYFDPATMRLYPLRREDIR